MLFIVGFSLDKPNYEKLVMFKLLLTKGYPQRPILGDPEIFYGFSIE